MANTTMTVTEIQAQLERCGFASGDKFTSATQVREYLTVAVQGQCFGIEADLSQEQLDAMAEYVVRTRFHMA